MPPSDDEYDLAGLAGLRQRRLRRRGLRQG
jgi:hypothetical protein